MDESEALTKREAQIVEGIRLGLTNKQIGRKLGISPTTVKTHLENIFHKLNVTHRVQLAILTGSPARKDGNGSQSGSSGSHRRATD